MRETYTLEKEIWTEADFENMGWNDNTIHAFSVDYDYKFLHDIDSIFKCIPPKSEKYFKF